MEESNYFEQIESSVELPKTDMIVAVLFNDSNTTPYITNFLVSTKTFALKGASTYPIEKVKYWLKPV